MKIIIFIALAWWSLAAAASPEASRPAHVASIIAMPWDIAARANFAAEIKRRGFNHATFYISWNDVEKVEGVYDFKHYHKYLDALVKDGISLILVLDMGGKPYLDETGKVIPGEYTIPQWIYKKYPDSTMANFSGQGQRQLALTPGPVQKHSVDFIKHAVRHFLDRYQTQILGFAIGLQEEHEIKYGQTGYQWRDYSGSAESDFQKKYGAKQPIINYNNEIRNGHTTTEPLLYAHKEFRENRLAEATCLYSKAIRERGGAAIGYFAETFTSHDAIYATGVIEKLVPCIDIAVIDYNFYDGYSLISDWKLLPTLTNYMASLGYKKIMVGAYAEQWERQKKTAELLPVINRTIAESLAQPNVIGFEIGGLQQQATATQSASIDMDKLNAIAIKTPVVAPRGDTPKIKVGILGSTTSFYVWHGDRTGGRNIHHDALFEAYRILSAHKSMDVRIIGEKNISDEQIGLSDLDAIFVPHQTAFSNEIKSKLKDFWLNGGALIQDMRLGEFDENGKPTNDWMHEVFGIQTIEWKKKGGVFVADGKVHRLKPSLRSYVNYALLTPRPGYKLLATDPLQREKGIMLRGDRTLVFGFSPQLIEDDTKEIWRDILVREVLKVAPQRSGRKDPVRSAPSVAPTLSH